MRTADIHNDYIQVPIAEKICTVLVPEFVPDDGESEVVFRALCGLKNAGAIFRNHLAD